MTQIKFCVVIESNDKGKYPLIVQFCPSECVKLDEGNKINISTDTLQEWLNSNEADELKEKWAENFNANTMELKAYLRHIETRDCLIVVSVNGKLNFEVKTGEDAKPMVDSPVLKQSRNDPLPFSPEKQNVDYLRAPPQSNHPNVDVTARRRPTYYAS